MHDTPTRPPTLLRRWILQSLLVAGATATLLYFVVGRRTREQELGLAADLAIRASHHVLREIEDRWLPKKPGRLAPGTPDEFAELERLFAMHRESLAVRRIVWFDEERRIVHCGDPALTGASTGHDAELARVAPGAPVVRLIPAGDALHGDDADRHDVPLLEVYVAALPAKVSPRLHGHVIELYLDATDIVARVDASQRFTLLAMLAVGAALFVAVFRLVQSAQAQLAEQNARLRAFTGSLEREVDARTQELIRTRRLADVGTLAAGLAHEINNPLAVIGASAQGLLDRLRRAPDAAAAERADFEEYLRAIEAETFRCKRITESLLSFARKRPAELRRADLREVVAEAVDLVRPLATSRGQVLDFAAGAQELPVDVAEHEIKQLLLNLFANAFDAGARGLAVEVRCGRSDGQAWFTVRDRGRGFAGLEPERLFEPFFTTKPPGEGVGMGLSISRQIAELHRGRLVAERPDDGVGACFRCVLPLAAVPAATEPIR